MAELPEDVRRNRAHWDQLAAKFVAAGEHGWACNEPSWGIWGAPEREVSMFPDKLAGTDVIELGCGTAYVSSWLARRGARVVGIENSEQQLATARRLQREHGLDFPLIHGNAESVPYPDASFDFGISEYGACLWADPQRWVPEASRLLRPGGRLHFLVNRNFRFSLTTAH
jgi:SAM-dependent methyltransferase